MELIHVEVTPKVAAKLVLLDEVDLHAGWTSCMAEKVLHEVGRFDIDELLRNIDAREYPLFADCDRIPQFGKLENVRAVPHVIVQTGTSLNYAQLGLKLKGDISSTPGANLKYGENHGKGAAFLGLVMVEDGFIKASSLSQAYCQIQETEKACRVATMLLFRIPVVRMLLKNARAGETNGFLPLLRLADSTRIRRSQSIRTIFKELKTLNHPALNTRINHIVWNEMESNDGTEI